MNIHQILERQNRYIDSWAKTAAVTEHQEILNTLSGMHYDPTYDDFVKEYLPFYTAESWAELTDEQHKQLLSFGWFMYNLKTIIIEQSALTEYCKTVLSGCSSFAFTRYFIHRLSQVQVDETYHTLMSYKGIDLCERLRTHGLSIFPDTDLANYINSCQLLTAADRELAWLALTTVCEATISKYLSVLPGVSNVQPAFRFIADMHRQDEASHSSLFMDLIAVAYTELDEYTREKFTTFLKKSITVLTSVDRKTWSHLYSLVGIPLPKRENPSFLELYNFRMLKKYTGVTNV
ncbi:diiron oxygenase [Dickeya oryzae]|uniref:Diiron oxygenase n=1 Tax=Dickeya oryzae TaxID=1240404 RepID=A0AB39IU15_9GAMM|nr:diiron oxygenase [Dickeya oryzae]MBP2857291.1 diiron oxygenase [Dickeya oryzae]MCA6989326.1 diiron oxygenase [Dickeya oryzae]